MALSKLDAVNIMLEAVGESPVSSLSSGLPEAEAAERFLDRLSQEIQEQGWSFNTDSDYEMSVDSDGFIKLNADILRIDTTGRDKWRAVSVRIDTNDNDQRKLYNNDENTYNWEDLGVSSVFVDVVNFLDFDNLPFTAANYIAYEAAVNYQTSTLGSRALDGLLKERWSQALTRFQDSEADQEDTNMLTASPYMRMITRRVNDLSN